MDGQSKEKEKEAVKQLEEEEGKKLVLSLAELNKQVETAVRLARLQAQAKEDGYTSIFRWLDQMSQRYSFTPASSSTNQKDGRHEHQD